MNSFTVLLPLLLYAALIILGVAVAIYFISFLRTATRYLELKVQEMEDKLDQQL
jgi:hypothetical protein